MVAVDDVLLSFPAPYYGGKRKAAEIVWNAFGEVDHYVEPFCGTAAVLLATRAHPSRRETVNDASGYIVNALRALKYFPDETAEYATWPVSETDLHARHLWLINEGRPDVNRLTADESYCDPKAAGYWIYGQSIYIGSDWCSGIGPWTQEAVLRGVPDAGQKEKPGIQRKRPVVGGRGVHRYTPPAYLGLPASVSKAEMVRTWFRMIQERLERVRILCGDWSRVVTERVLFGDTNGIAGVFLDPPYRQDNGRDTRLYPYDRPGLAAEVNAWAVANGNNPRLRIVLAGWAGDFDPPPGWTEIAWSPDKDENMDGKANRARERLWLSPHCAKRQLMLDLALWCG
jgi:hypothetical protein